MKYLTISKSTHHHLYKQKTPLLGGAVKYKLFVFNLIVFNRRIVFFQSTFLAHGQVRSNVTLESLEIFRELIRDYSKTFEESDLEKTKNLLIKQNTRRFETLSNLLDMLDSMTRFQLKESYIEEQQETLVKMNLDEIRDLANQYLNENNMIYVIAGDSKTQLSQVKEFGYGEPILLDRDGNKVSNYE